MLPIIFAIVPVDAAMAADAHKTFGEVFSGTLRQSLFTGFLGLGGLFMAGKAFYVVQLRDKIYSTGWYARRVQLARKRNEKVGSIGQPLKELAVRLNNNIIVAFAVALLQITLGLVGETWSALVCVAAAIVAVIYTIQSMLLLRKNLRILLDVMDEEAENQLITDEPEHLPSEFGHNE
jgi:uncharacterized membrane protein YqhA